MHINEIENNSMTNDIWIVENPQNHNGRFSDFCEQSQENIQRVMKFYMST